MKVFVTGGTGAIGKFLLPLLVENRHEVVALTRSATKAVQLEDGGVSAVIADPLNKQQLTAAVRRAESTTPGDRVPGTPGATLVEAAPAAPAPAADQLSRVQQACAQKGGWYDPGAGICDTGIGN